MDSSNHSSSVWVGHDLSHFNFREEPSHSRLAIVDQTCLCQAKEDTSYLGASLLDVPCFKPVGEELSHFQPVLSSFPLHTALPHAPSWPVSFVWDPSPLACSLPCSCSTNHSSHFPFGSHKRKLWDLGNHYARKPDYDMCSSCHLPSSVDALLFSSVHNQQESLAPDVDFPPPVRNRHLSPCSPKGEIMGYHFTYS